MFRELSAPARCPAGRASAAITASHAAAPDASVAPRGTPQGLKLASALQRAAQKARRRHASTPQELSTATALASTRQRSSAQRWRVHGPATGAQHQASTDHRPSHRLRHPQAPLSCLRPCARAQHSAPPPAEQPAAHVHPHPATDAARCCAARPPQRRTQHRAPQRSTAHHADAPPAPQRPVAARRSPRTTRLQPLSSPHQREHACALHVRSRLPAARSCASPSAAAALRALAPHSEPTQHPTLTAAQLAAPAAHSQHPPHFPCAAGLRAPRALATLPASRPPRSE